MMPYNGLSLLERFAHLRFKVNQIRQEVKEKWSPPSSAQFRPVWRASPFPQVESLSPALSKRRTPVRHRQMSDSSQTCGEITGEVFHGITGLSALFSGRKGQEIPRPRIRRLKKLIYQIAIRHLSCPGKGVPAIWGNS